MVLITTVTGAFVNQQTSLGGLTLYGYTAISHGSNRFRFRGGMSKLDHHWTAKIRNPGGVTTLFDTWQETLCVFRYCISSISYLNIYIYMYDMCMCLVRLLHLIYYVFHYLRSLFC